MIGTAWPAIIPAVATGAGNFSAVTTQLGSQAFSIEKVGAGTVQYASPTGNTYFGLTSVSAGTLQLDDAGTGLAIQSSLIVGLDTPVNQVQTLTFIGFVQGDQYTLQYGAISSFTPTTYDGNPTYEAPLIQAALDVLLGGDLVTVTPISATVFSVSLDLFGASSPNTISAVDITTPAATAASTINPLPISAPYAPESAVVQLEASNQIAPTANVVVGNDGLLDINNFTQTLGSLTINTGTVTTGSGANFGTLTLGSLTMTNGTLLEPGAGAIVTVNNDLNMTGGAIDLSGASSRLTLLGNVIATSDASAANSGATGAADIFGVGTLVLNSATPTFTISPSGLQPSDMIVSAIIQAANGITKAGNGRLELAAASDDNAATYTATTTVTAGDLQTDSVFTLTLGSMAVNDTFRLTYNNGFQSGQTSSLNYTGTVGATGTDGGIVSALVNLLMGTFGFTSTAAQASVIVNPLSNNIFTIALTGLAAVDLGSLSGAIVTSASGTIHVARSKNIGAVVLNGAGSPSPSVSGTGMIGQVTLASAASTGEVDPGNNGVGNAVGILNTTGDVTLNANTTFFVDLSHTSANLTPVVGLDYDQLSVAGNVTLNNALLAGQVEPGITVGQSFTILAATGMIMGNFTGSNGTSLNAVIGQGDSLFIDGQKFSVQYNTNSVILTRMLDAATVEITASPGNPSVYGQDVIYTATVTPEPGAGDVPVGTQVTFTLDQALFGNAFTLTVPENTPGQATFSASFDPETQFGNVWIPGSAHTIDATFNDPNVPPTFANASGLRP